MLLVHSCSRSRGVRELRINSSLPGLARARQEASRNRAASAGIPIHIDGESGMSLYMISMRVVRRRLGMALVRGIG